jgi:excinuclease UvrABC nuclease subunit
VVIIYLIFKKGECVYVGQTVQTLAQRKGKELSDARKGRGSALGAAIRKHGEHSFAWVKYIECKTQKELCKLEKELIATYKPRYNLQVGGKSQFNPWNKDHKEKRPQVLSKISQAAKNRKRTKRGKYSDEHKKRISEAGLEVRKKPFVCNETGEIFYNIKTCAQHLNLNIKSLAVLMCGKSRLKSLKGYTFSYIAQNKPALIDLETRQGDKAQGK